MGSLYRRAICAKCRKKHMTAPEQCACGNKSFRLTSWIVAWYVSGKRFEKALPGATKAEAARMLKKLEGDAVKGIVGIRTQKRTLVRDFVLGDYWNLHARHLKSGRDYYNRIRQHIVPVFGDLYLDQVEVKDVERWLSKLSEINKPATVRKQLEVLRGVFNKAVEWGDLNKNPLSRVRRRQPNNNITRYLEPEEFQHLLVAAEETGHPLLKSAIILAVGTMLRKENLFGLKWKSVNLKRGVIEIPGEETKSAKFLPLPIIEPVHNALLEIPKGLHSEYVLNNPRTGTRYKEGMRGPFERAKKIAGLEPPRLRWHDLRCTGASWHVQAGTDLYIVQKMMGHSTSEMTKRYAHLAPEYTAEAAENVSKFFQVTIGQRLDMGI